MNTATVAPAPAAPFADFRKQSTSAASAEEASRSHGPLRVLGSAVRAVRIFADTAFRVTVLGADSVKY